MTIRDYSFLSFSYYYRCRGEVDQNFIQILFSRDRFPGLSTLALRSVSSVRCVSDIRVISFEIFKSHF